MERKVAFKALVGSHNYNLNTLESDIDFKVFVFPTFDDLYSGKMYSKQTVTDTEDNNVHDIRKLGELLWKANVNFVEVLFSKQLNIPSHSVLEVNSLLNMRDELARMNLPYLLNACIGMHHEKVKRLEHGTEGTMHLVEKFGFDVKQAQHAFRVLNFLERFEANKFTDFGDAIEYGHMESSRELPVFDGMNEYEFLRAIKKGRFPLDDMRDRLRIYLAHVKQNLEPVYFSQSPNEETKEKLESLVVQMVKNHLEM